MKKLALPGNGLIALRTQVKAGQLHPNLRTGLGRFIESSHIDVDGVAIVEAGETGPYLRSISVEETTAFSFRLLNPQLFSYDTLTPRSLSFLPIARGCQAACPFCFSEASASAEQEQARVWTVRPAMKGEPPVDWSHWDPADPDKLLRLYDWQRYGYMDGEIFPYEATDFVLDTHTGKTATLPTELPNWSGKKDGWEVIAHWYSEMEGRQYALIESDQKNLWIGNFWLVALNETQMQVKDLTTTMRKAVNDLLSDRRPEVAAGDFLVSYPIEAGKGAADKSGLAEVPFVANAPSSDQTEFQLNETVTIRLSDGSVLGASSDEKRLEPFVTNAALRQTDETLNTMFQAALKSMSPMDAEAFKKTERDWIVQRDADASQAVNITPYGSTQQACEDARENSLLESTNKRIKELKHQFR